MHLTSLCQVDGLNLQLTSYASQGCSPGSAPLGCSWLALLVKLAGFFIQQCRFIRLEAYFLLQLLGGFLSAWQVQRPLHRGIFHICLHQVLVESLRL